MNEGDAQNRRSQARGCGFGPTRKRVHAAPASAPLADRREPHEPQNPVRETYPPVPDFPLERPCVESSGQNGQKSNCDRLKRSHCADQLLPGRARNPTVVNLSPGTDMDA